MKQQIHSGWVHWSKSTKLYYIYLLISKNFEEAEIFLSYLQANKLVYPSITDTGRRHETPGSETKVFIAHSSNSSQRINIFLCQFPDPQFP